MVCILIPLRGIYNRSCTNLVASVPAGHGSWTVVEPTAVGTGTGSPCSRTDSMCSGIPSAIERSTSLRLLPDGDAPRKVRYVGTPDSVGMLDDHDVFGHGSTFPTDRRAARSTSAYPYGPRR